MENKKISPQFETLAILDAERKDEESGITFPPVDSVKEAKDWVDDNKK